MLIISAPALDTFPSTPALASVANDLVAGVDEYTFTLDRALSDEEKGALEEAQCTVYKRAFHIVPTSKPSDIYAAGFDGNSFDSREEAEAAIPGLAATMPAGDPGADPDFWTVTEE